ncbi:MAG: AraC family transcriptional regulator [Clostridiales Family XIII bacterium]|jgi:AraC-like DNA-binding protein|nr:AraC family transcriptional regulator [Clostridiales Family XIII bacterium]
MRQQQVFYDDSLPVNIVLADIRDIPAHYHEDTELVFLLSGGLRLRNGYFQYTMRPGDVFIVSPREVHGYACEEGENLTMLLQIDNQYFSRLYPDFANCFFVTDLDHPDSNEMESLREVLARLIMEAAASAEGYEVRILEQMHSLVPQLMGSFQNFRMENGRFVNTAASKGNPVLADRMNRVQDFLYDNYQRKLTLQEISEREHLSVYYLSHVIKSCTGMSFRELLCFVRVEESEKLLLATDMKVSAISEAVGFSAVRYYQKYFELWYGRSPQAYRAQFGTNAATEGAEDVRGCTYSQVSAAVKRISNAVYRAYNVVPRSPSRSIEADLGNCVQGGARKVWAEGTPLDRFFAERRRDGRAAVFLHDLLLGLEEPVCAAGEDYTVTAVGGTRCGEVAGVSVLLYNTEAWAAHAETAHAETAPCARAFCVRLVGLSGRFRVRRVHYGSRNISAAAEGERLKHSPKSERDARRLLCCKVDAWPAVTDTQMTAVGNLTLEVSLEGFSGELILIERMEGGEV